MTPQEIRKLCENAYERGRAAGRDEAAKAIREAPLVMFTLDKYREQLAAKVAT